MASHKKEEKGEGYVVIPLRKPPEEVIGEVDLDKKGANKK